MKIKYLLFSIVLICYSAIVSCNKNEWKETVSTEIKIQRTNSTVYFGVNTLEIDTAVMRLESISLTGNRIQAEDINLSETIDSEFELTSDDKLLINSFDIPQGTYETMQILTKWGSSSESIYLHGTYTNASGNPKNVILSLHYNELILQSVLDNNSQLISIDKNDASQIIVTVDVAVLFDNLNPSMWNAADQSTVQGQNTIVVSSNSNSSIYNSILPKISESISYGFE